MLNKTIPPNRQFLATILAYSVIPISGLATDIYLPSMPKMAKSLGLPESKIQLTLTIFLICYGVSQFFAGAIVDAFGRYKISIISLILFIITFYITATTTNIYVIYLMRAFHGILSGFAVVSKRAYFVDVYEGEERKRYLSSMTIVWSLAPVIAPFLGGFLQKNFGWQSNFYALAIYSAIILVLELFFSGETIKIRKPFKMDFLMKEFGLMIKTQDFFYGLLMCGISYSLVIFYNLCGPFIIEHKMGFSAMTTGYVSLFMGVAWMCGGFLGRALINRTFFPKIRYANFLQILFILVMFGTSFFISNLYTLAIFAFLVHLTAGFIFNNYFAFCVGRFPDSAGIAGGLTGAVDFILTSALSYGVIVIVHPISQMYVAIGYLILSIIGFIVLAVVKYKKAHI